MHYINLLSLAQLNRCHVSNAQVSAHDVITKRRKEGGVWTLPTNHESVCMNRGGDYSCLCNLIGSQKRQFPQQEQRLTHMCVVYRKFGEYRVVKYRYKNDRILFYVTVCSRSLLIDFCVSCLLIKIFVAFQS